MINALNVSFSLGLVASAFLWPHSRFVHWFNRFAGRLPFRLLSASPKLKRVRPSFTHFHIFSHRFNNPKLRTCSACASASRGCAASAFR